MTLKKTPTLQERLRGLAVFLPLFEEPGFSFGEWSKPEKTEPGVLTMPCFFLSETARSFVQSAYDLGWVRGDFDWGEWKETVEAIRLRDDAEYMASATPDQLARLLTVLIRQDRFCEGSLAAAYESGLLTAIVLRAARLAEEIDGGAFA